MTLTLPTETLPGQTEDWDGSDAVGTIRVLIADESSLVADNITRRLSLEGDLVVCASVRDGETAVQEALRLRPDIAIVDAGLPGLDGGQTTEMLAQYVPGTGVIMMSMEAENDAYRLAMLAGAREFLQKPFKGDDLVAAVRRVHAFEQRKTPAAAPLRVQPAAAHFDDEPPPRAADSKGSVTTVVSGKGGVGKTTLAANLAVALAADHPRRVVLVDASLQFGDVAAFLNLKTERTIVDVVSAGAIDPELVRDTLLDGPAGIRVLLAPSSPELAEYVTPANLRAVLEVLTSLADHVVVDTASSMSDVTLTALEMSDHVLLVTDLSVPGVKNARLVAGVLDTLKLDPDRVLAVGNHCDAAGELDRTAAESFLGMALALEVPLEPRFVATSIAEGDPMVRAHPGIPASRAVRALARLVDPSSQSSSGDVHGSETSGKKRRSRRRLGHRD